MYTYILVHLFHLLTKYNEDSIQLEKACKVAFSGYYEWLKLNNVDHPPPMISFIYISDTLIMP